MQLQTANDELRKEIAERKRVEEALRENRELLRVTLSSIGDAVMTADSQGRIVFLNPVAEALTGWKLQEADRPAHPERLPDPQRADAGSGGEHCRPSIARGARRRTGQPYGADGKRRTRNPH